jgi:type I restriction enzyme S subunit
MIGSNEIILGATNTQFIDGDRSARYPKREEYVDSGIMFLNGESISRGTINKEAVNFITEQKYNDIKKGRIAQNDILITTRGNSIGDAAFVTTNDKGLINAQMLILRANSRDIYPKYLFHYITSKSLRNYILNFASGSAQPQIPIRDLKKIPIYLPKIQVQRNIAAILSAYDDLIEINRRRIALLEKMAEEIYREWFVRMRFPGHEKVKIVKGVPEGWQSIPSSSLFHVLSGGTPNTDNPVYWDGNIPFFTPRDAGDNYYVLGTEKHLTQKGLDSCNSRLYKKDTIFITARGTVGKIGLAYRDMAMNQSCYALMPRVKGSVYFHFLSMKNAITYIKGVSKSGVFDNIIVDTFNVVPILLPSQALIAEFNEIASPIFKQLGVLLEANEHLLKTRDKLLPRLISGKLSVENLDIRFPPSMEEISDEV